MTSYTNFIVSGGISGTKLQSYSQEERTMQSKTTGILPFVGNMKTLPLDLHLEKGGSVPLNRNKMGMNLFLVQVLIPRGEGGNPQFISWRQWKSFQTHPVQF